jgi:hypothetical protein
MTWWAPRVRSWWIGVLFALGSACFAIGPFPGFVHLVGAQADAAVFFAGSIAFTTAAALQCIPLSWAAGVQLPGTLFFNLSTWDALDQTLSNADENRLVWAPDVFGSVCFLVASTIAYVPLRHEPGSARRIAVINLAGSVAFGVSAIASYVVPETGDALDLAAANVTTVIGALCFLAGALLLLRGAGAASPDPDDAIPSGVLEPDVEPRTTIPRSPA